MTVCQYHLFFMDPEVSLDWMYAQERCALFLMLLLLLLEVYALCVPCLALLQSICCTIHSCIADHCIMHADTAVHAVISNSSAELLHLLFDDRTHYLHNRYCVCLLAECLQTLKLHCNNLL